MIELTISRRHHRNISIRAVWYTGLMLIDILSAILAFQRYAIFIPQRTNSLLSFFACKFFKASLVIWLTFIYNQR